MHLVEKVGWCFNSVVGKTKRTKGGIMLVLQTTIKQFHEGRKTQHGVLVSSLNKMWQFFSFTLPSPLGVYITIFFFPRAFVSKLANYFANGINMTLICLFYCKLLYVFEVDGKVFGLGVVHWSLVILMQLSLS